MDHTESCHVYFSQHGETYVHQNCVCPCPAGFPSGYYWYGRALKGPRQPPRWVEKLLSRGPGSDDTSEAPLSHLPDQRAPDCTLEDLELNVVGEHSDNWLSEKHNTEQATTEAASALTPQPSLISEQTQPLLQDSGTDDSLESETHGNGSDTTLGELPVATESTGGVTKESATCQAEDPNPPNISGPEPAQEAGPRLRKRGNCLRRTVRPPDRY